MDVRPTQEENLAQFHTVDQTTAPEFFTQFLDIANAQASMRNYKYLISHSLQLQEGHAVLDLGCGPGDDVLALAQLVGKSGQVVGIDNSEHMILEAQKRLEGLDLPVYYYIADAHHLPFSDATFDGCRAERVFMHVDNPRQVLAELLRVARSNARIVVSDIDWDASVIDHPDRALTRKVIHLMCDNIRHGWIGRQLPALFREMSVVDVVATPFIHPLDYTILKRLSQGMLQHACDEGKISSAELTSWWQYLDHAYQEGRFFATAFYVIVSGKKP